MANLIPRETFKQVGDFMRKLCKDRAKCERMVKDINFATTEFSTVVTLPPGHKIMVHLDEENVTHIVIPLKKDIEGAEVTVETHKDRVYPHEYNPNPLSTIPEDTAPLQALSFIVGEYTMRRCKN
jgi:hypothetical protein